jgi:hypothetical protein
VLDANPWGSAYDTSLGLDMVYTIASGFITSCPSTNAALPVKAFPALAVSAAAPGESATFTFQGDNGLMAIFYSGIGTQVVMLDDNKSAVIPKGLQGISYVLISSASTAAEVTSDNIVAGPAILDYPFDAWTANPAFTGM